MAGHEINGAARAIYSTVAAAATVISVIGGILFNGVDADLNRHEKQMETIRLEASASRQDIRGQLQKQIDDIVTGRLETAERVRALEAAIVEIETQFRALSTVANVERQMDQTVKDLLQQCPTCKLPEREFFPAGPGPNGKP